MDARSEIKWQILMLVTVSLLAVALRFYNLGGFAFFGDEFSTVKSVLSNRITEPNWPFLFGVTKWICAALGVSEFTVRLVPAVLGVLCIPAFYFAGRGSFGGPAMVLSGLCIALNHWHLFHSQSGRFYTAVFLFDGLAICWLASSLQNGRVLPAVLAGLSVCLGTGFHPTAIWPAMAFAVYLSIAGLVPQLRKTIGWKVALGFFTPVAIVGAGYFPLRAVQTVEYIAKRHVGAQWGFDVLHLVLGWIRGLEAPLLVMGGCWLLGCLARNRRIGLLLTVMCFLPIAALSLLAHYNVAVRQDYAFAAAPVWFFLAGSGIASVAASRVVPLAARAGVVVAFCVALLPSAFSHHTANLTCDHRVAFDYLKNHATKDDLFFHNFVPMLDFYTGLRADPIESNPEEQLRKAAASGKRCWFLIIASRSGINNPALEEWLKRHALLVRRFDAKRFDYEVKSLHVYMYDPKQRE